MKPMRDLNHYELLELSRDARAEEIERAYALVREAYAPGSLASYSVLDEQEAAAVRQQVETAYSILSDSDRREAYNASLAGGGGIAGDELIVVEPYENARVAEPEEKPPGALDEFEDIDDGDPDAPWDGSRLRRARLARGAEIDAIAAVTKVNPSYLRGIEEENFEALPAPVYVRGFVDAYARFLDLDARSVAASYTERLKDYLETVPRPRRMGRSPRAESVKRG